MKSEKGFTLVESLVAAVLLVLLVGFIFTIFISTRQGLRQSENHITATMLARSVLNDVYLLGYDPIPVGTGVRKDIYTLEGYDGGNKWGMKFFYNVDVLEDTAYQNKTVIVKFTWEEKGRQENVILETVYTKLY